MRSMTGFGVGEASLAFPGVQAGAGRLVIEVRAVNHRFLDVRVRVPSHLPDLASVVEGLARERLGRGRFDITVRLDGGSLGAAVIDRGRARAALIALRELRDELAPDADVPLSLLAAVPDLFIPPLEQYGDSLRAATAEALDAALQSLDAMRTREGAALGADLARRVSALRRLSETIRERAPQVVDAYKKRLRERAERLRSSVDVEVDPWRLEQELTIFADRADVTEELTRLDTHVSHLESVLASPDSVGRRLDFLLQEMAREANTIGSKSQDVAIAHAVVELKAEIERMREQVQNIE